MCNKDWIKTNTSKKIQKDCHVSRKDYFVVFTYCFRFSIGDDVFQYNGAYKGKALANQGIKIFI